MDTFNAVAFGADVEKTNARAQIADHPV